MEDVKKGSVSDFIMSILLLIFGIALIISSLNMKVFNTFLDAPGFFPMLLGIIFIFLGLMMLFSSIRRKGPQQLGHVFGKANMGAFFKHIEFKRVMILIGLMVVYIFGLIGRMHFAIATTIYLFCTMWFLKSTGLVKNIIISVVASIVISVVFRFVFKIPLP
ncbi:MAG: hypothetical protein CVV48_10050 [Spirochaetae bacterium HGW-Spirochaetae-4]|jgi:hypothetical protein|nr:MAG: hypothetical protein A2Y31_02590 [Spirochaetes bacterium GWC2_52_13]PKL20982.1 MAG: hypothetical protein CVV48_10050 [Spirochaetae bacterium HGW-Spirochaetae-4]HCG64629.1 hypothetical protein [Sphaerochaeta sp.]